MHEHLVPAKNQTAACIVTFHPDNRIIEHANIIASQVDHLYIIDNASDPNTQEMLQEKLSNLPDVSLIINQENFGLAYGLNQALELSFKQNYEWLIILDQDSAPRPDMFDKLADTFVSCSKTKQVAVVGSNYLDRATGNAFFKPDDTISKRGWIETMTVISSGSMISLSATRIIGKFRDSFFIGHVDDEFCLRARQKGFAVILSTDVLMEHSIGKALPSRILWKPVIASHAPSKRWYYHTRNHVILIREYLLKEPRWVLDSMITRSKEIIIMLCCEDNRLRKFEQIIKGICHGLLGIEIISNKDFCTENNM